MIEVVNVNKAYGPLSVLKNINETLPSSGITSIIGPNGAGKSTLLSVISRLLKPDSGEVRIDSLIVNEAHSEKLARIMSVLRQENQVTSRLSVYDLVSFGRYPYSKGRITENDKHHIHQALYFLDLLPLAERYLDELSGGQRQRAFVAMVLCQNTKYVLLDEPLNNLDIKHSVTMMKQLRRAADELGKSIILVIHDINFASTYSDHIIAMKNGAVFFCGSPADMMKPDLIERLFEIPVAVETVAGQHIAVYYR